MEKRLGGKVAIVTGAGSGIGKATAMLFAAEGAKVTVAEINAEPGEKAVQEIRDAGGEAIFVQADVTNESDAANMAKATVEKFGRLNILFNNVGTGSGGTVVSVTEEYWDEIMNRNLKPAFLGSKYAIPEMIKAGGGSIINMASIGGLSGRFSATFCASKGGIVHLTRSMAVAHARDNVRVNCVCPGYIDTPMIGGMLSDPERRKAVGAKHPMNRVGTAEEIAYAVIFLASDEASFVTGVVLPVDGGFTAQ
ncbi:SDR family NAD(P)-dependent oxidoreductase [Candidatus Poribacteria bacterium]